MKDFREENLVKIIRVRKADCVFSKCVFWLPLLYESILAGFLAFGEMTSKQFFSLTPVACSLFNCCIQSTDNCKKKNLKFLGRLTDDILDKIEDNFCSVYRMSDITIIPKNIKIGENLEAANIIPIFKKGHFIIVKGLYSPVVLAQYKDDYGGYCVKILDNDEASEEIANLDEKEKRMLERKRNKILSFIIDK